MFQEQGERPDWQENQAQQDPQADQGRTADQDRTAPQARQEMTEHQENAVRMELWELEALPDKTALQELLVYLVPVDLQGGRALLEPQEE